MRRAGFLWSVLAIVITGLTTFSLAWAAILRCSGDTDDCDPSWANGVLLVVTVVAGVALAVAVPRRVSRKASSGRLSVPRAVAYTFAGAVLLLVLFLVLAAVLPE